MFTVDIFKGKPFDVLKMFLRDYFGLYKYLISQNRYLGMSIIVKCNQLTIIIDYNAINSEKIYLQTLMIYHITT